MCQALLDQVSELAKQHQANSVETIEIRWGPLSGVEISLLQRAFEIARQGTIAKEATLVVQQLPVRVSCKLCGQGSEVTSNNLLCGYCGSWHTQLINGDEMLLSQVVLEKST